MTPSASFGSVVNRWIGKACVLAVGMASGTSLFHTFRQQTNRSCSILCGSLVKSKFAIITELLNASKDKPRIPTKWTG